MKVVKLKDCRKRPPDPREQMRLALMELVREAQAGHKQAPDNSWLMRSARFIGSAAGRIHRIWTIVWMKLTLIITAVYMLMHWAGISIGVFHDLDLLFTIK